MATFHGPETKQFAATVPGELLTYYASNGDAKLVGISIRFFAGPHPNGLLVLKSLPAGADKVFPYIMAIETGNQLCCSFGTEFHIQSTTPPAEIIYSENLKAGRILYTHDIPSMPVICCSHAQSTQFISMETWKTVGGPHVGKLTTQLPKWRVLKTTKLGGSFELEEFATFPA
ncbi:MAG: hypothetical protein WBR15_10760 [Gammaproteobacteria bacterium]